MPKPKPAGPERKRDDRLELKNRRVKVFEIENHLSQFFVGSLDFAT